MICTPGTMAHLSLVVESGGGLDPACLGRERHQRLVAEAATETSRHPCPPAADSDGKASGPSQRDSLYQPGGRQVWRFLAASKMLSSWLGGSGAQAALSPRTSTLLAAVPWGLVPESGLWPCRPRGDFPPSGLTRTCQRWWGPWNYLSRGVPLSRPLTREDWGSFSTTKKDCRGCLKSHLYRAKNLPPLSRCPSEAGVTRQAWSSAFRHAFPSPLW